MDTVCCVYKIQHKLDVDNIDFYIGSTKNLYQRKKHHKFKCKESNIPLYKYIRDNGGWSNFEFTILENVDDNDELLLKERFYIDQLNPTLNCVMPYRTDEEIKEQKKIYMKEYDKEYRKNNKEKINKYHKEWYESNKDIILLQKKKYRDANREKNNKRARELVLCECGSEVSRDSLRRHIKSNKHLNKIK